MRRVQEDRSDRAPLRALDRHRLCGALALVLCLRLWRTRHCLRKMVAEKLIKILRLSMQRTVQSSRHKTRDVGVQGIPIVGRHEAALLQSTRCELRELRRSGNYGLRGVAFIRGVFRRHALRGILWIE